MRAMQQLLAAGVSARQAAEAVLSTPAGDVPAAPPHRPARPGRDRGQALAARPDAGAVRRCRRERRARSPARRRGRHDRDLRGDRPLSRRPRRALGGRERDHRRGALRDQPDPRPPPGTRPRLGRRQRPSRPPGMPKRRAARPRPDLLRDRPSRPRLAHHLPRRRHPAADPDRSRGPTRTEHHRAGGDQAITAASARRRDSNHNRADRRCRTEARRARSPTSSAQHSSTSIPSPPQPGSQRTSDEPRGSAHRPASTTSNQFVEKAGSAPFSTSVARRSAVQPAISLSDGHTFRGESRAAFRVELALVERTRARGRAWALSSSRATLDQILASDYAPNTPATAISRRDCES